LTTTTQFKDWTKLRQCYTCQEWVLKEDRAWIWKIKASKPGGRRGAYMCNKCLGVDVWVDLEWTHT